MPEVTLRWTPTKPGVLLLVLGGLTLYGPRTGVAGSGHSEHASEDVEEGLEGDPDLRGRPVLWNTRRNARSMAAKKSMQPQLVGD
eukprot:3940032-Rhodomonas_salina.1